MKRKFKLIIFIILGLILLLAIWALPPLWQEYQENKPVTYEQTENYIIKETTEGRVIENKKVGLTFSVPEEWTVDNIENPENPTYIEETGIAMVSPGAEPNSDYIFIIPKKGCSIIINVSNEDNNPEKEYIEQEIESGTTLSSTRKIINISNKKGIYAIYGSDEELENMENDLQNIKILIPYKNNLYSIETYITYEDREYCREKWDEFIETVIIQ